MSHRVSGSVAGMAAQHPRRRAARGAHYAHRGAADQRAPTEGPWVYRFVAVLATLLLKPFVHIDARQLQIAETTRTAVVVVNHRSFLDALVGLVVFHRLRRYPRVIVAEHWFEYPVIGRLLRSGARSRWTAETPLCTSKAPAACSTPAFRSS